MNFKRLIAQKVPPDHNSYLSAKKNSFPFEIIVFKSATLKYSFYTKTFENVKIAIIFFKTYLLTAAIFASRICKGQLISKGLCGILTSPKKRTKKFDFTTIITGA